MPQDDVESTVYVVSDQRLYVCTSALTMKSGTLNDVCCERSIGLIAILNLSIRTSMC